MMTMSVCLSVRLSASLSPELVVRSSPIFFICVTYGGGSVLFWRRCCMLFTSGLIDDVMFAHNERYAGVPV